MRPWYVVEDGRRLSRRGFLYAGSSLAAAALWADRALGRTLKAPTFSDYPFALGVASGDPAPDGVVLWTRLAPQPLEVGGGLGKDAIEVGWEVADDEGFSKVVRQGARIATPEFAHSVHVEVDGLSPDRWYFYRFKSGSEISPVGRTRTTPLPTAEVDKLRLAFASCQHFESGFFTAYEHMLADAPDIVLHLGDYIYEGAGKDKGVRKHHGAEINALDDYRARHAQYKTDKLLQGMHAGAPWLVTWDDHEFDNNYADSISEERHVKAEDFLARRARAYQAYYEHMPLRRASLPNGPSMQLYRRTSYGKLAELFVLDTRQYRTDQPCGDKTTNPCGGQLDPNATLLGQMQREWLFAGLSGSPAQWNVLAQQVMMARVDFMPGRAEAVSMDQWPGYEIDRQRVLRHFAENKIKNPVVLTGDIHSNWANELIAEVDPSGKIADPAAKPVAAEFVGTSISSGGDGNDLPLKELIAADNPFVKFHNEKRGYVRCDVTPEAWRADFQTVEYVRKPGAPVKTRARFTLQSGDSTLHAG